MKYFVVGFMASGKSQFAKKFGHQLNCRVDDSDEIISSGMGLSIDEIFKQKGEEYFRTLENEEMQKWLAFDEPFILSVGGGLPCHHDLMNKMNEVGKTVYLKRPFGMLLARLEQNPGGRPLAINANRHELENLFLQREPIYEQASYIIDDVSNPIDQLKNLIN